MQRLWPLLLAAAAVLVLALVIYSRAVSPIAANYSFSPFATEAAEENYPSWEPCDAKTIAYFADVDGVIKNFTKSLGSPTPAQITKSSTDCTNPFWSPDGARIYYFSRGLWSVERPAVSHSRLSRVNRPFKRLRYLPETRLRWLEALVAI